MMSTARPVPARIALVAGAALTLTMLAGCVSNSADDSRGLEVVATNTAAGGAGAVTDVQSCEAFADVATILHNATADLRSGSISQQEYDGWMRLATRVLGRIPTTGQGAVSDAIATLQAGAPALPAGSRAANPINTPEWNASTSVAQACQDAGGPVTVEAFTGG